MNKRFNLGTTIVMCMFIASCLIGQAFAQVSTSSLEEIYEEVEGQVEDLTVTSLQPQKDGISPNFVSESRFHAGFCRVGPASTDVIFTCFGWNFANVYPTGVFCQTRQSPSQNRDFGWTDQFGCQVIATSRTSVRVRIRRLDDGTGSSGWGQDLHVSFLIVD